MKRSTLLTVCLLALFAWTCSDQLPTESSGEKGEIMPLAVGNRWIGVTTKFDTNGLVTSTTFDTILVDTMVIEDGEPWYLSNRQIHERNTADGYWVWFKMIVGMELKFMTAKYPATVGEMFNLDTVLDASINGDNVDSALQYTTVLSTRRRVTVPAGTYLCYQYRTIMKVLAAPFALDGVGNEYQLYYDQYYAPGIGKVKGETFARTRTGRLYINLRWELVEFREGMTEG